MSSYRDVGVVLRTYKLREADRIIVLCTQGRGKVRAVANGVRKTKSKFGSRLEPGSHVIVQMYEGKGDLDTVTQAELVETNRVIREDLERWNRAAAILEAVDHVSQEGEVNAQLYEMCVGGLRAVAHWDTPLVVPGFFLKLLAAEGVGLIMDSCTECDATENLVSIDLVGGGMRCDDHREGIPISDQALLMMRLIVGGNLNQALSLPVGPATFEVDHIGGQALEVHLDRKLRALRLMDRH